MKRQWIWPLVVGLALTAYTVYMLMDTFVITRVYTVVEQTDEADIAQQEEESGADASSEDSADMSASDSESADNADNAENSGRSGSGGNGPGSSSGRNSHGGHGSSASGGQAPDNESDADYSADSSGSASGSAQTETGTSSSAEASDLIGTYTDDNISITLTSCRENDTTIYTAQIELTSADYLQTAFAQSAYGRNVTDTTSNIAEEVGAILAINGDYYGAQESGYVIRGGVLYRSESASDAGEQEDLVIWEDGSFSVITESDITAQELLEAGAREVLSFGPALIEDGEIAVSESDEVAKAQTDNPRTAIGILDELHYVFVVSDGRTGESEGLTLYELAEFMEDLGVSCAYNLDGGGSSTMVFQGEVINNPTTNGNSIKERSVSDIVYIGY